MLFKNDLQIGPPAFISIGSLRVLLSPEVFHEATYEVYIVHVIQVQAIPAISAPIATWGLPQFIKARHRLSLINTK
jgi:hypothetical protein